MVIEGVVQKRAMIKQSCQRSPILVAEQQDGSWETVGPGGRKLTMTEAVAMGKARRACAQLWGRQRPIGEGAEGARVSTWDLAEGSTFGTTMNNSQSSSSFWATDGAPGPAVGTLCAFAQLILTAP